MAAFSLEPRPLPAVDEPVLEPGLPLVDAHHHLWRREAGHPHHTMDFLVEDMARLAAGHDVVGTVYCGTGVGARAHGPEALRSVGETAFAVAQATATASGRFGRFRACTGIIVHEDLGLGAALGDVLDAHLDAGAGRFKGVRAYLARHGEPDLPDLIDAGAPERMHDPQHRAGAVEVAKRGLVLDWLVLQHHLPESVAYFDAVPELTFVLNHLGGRLAMGRFADADGLEQWRSGIREAARRPNVVLKLGGFGMWHVALPEAEPGRPMSQVMADRWRPLFEVCIEAFGPSRCMFESNFPVDAIAGSYRQVWNAYKLLCADLSPAERDDLLRGVAARTYSLDV